MTRSRWLKPAALFAAAAVALRAERRLKQVDQRVEDRYETGALIDQRVEEAAEDLLPEPTIWPVVLAFGVVFGLWGIILHTFFFGIGLLLAIIALAAWMNILFHERHEYIRTTPHEEPSSK